MALEIHVQPETGSAMSIKRLRDLCCKKPMWTVRELLRRQLLLPVLMLACIDSGHALQIDIAGPAGSAALANPSPCCPTAMSS